VVERKEHKRNNISFPGSTLPMLADRELQRI
jgi:hypothetical protein